MITGELTSTAALRADKSKKSPPPLLLRDWQTKLG